MSLCLGDRVTPKPSQKLSSGSTSSWKTVLSILQPQITSVVKAGTDRAHCRWVLSATSRYLAIGGLLAESSLLETDS